jgi:predicted acyltransferase
MGVLQRIALAWAAAAIIVHTLGDRGAWWAAAALLLGYWAAIHLFGRGADPYSLAGFFGTHWDRALLGEAHLYKGEGVPFDPEGLASTAPAVAQVLLGYLVGAQVRRARVDADLVVRLFVAGCAALALAYLWQLAMPLNKKIWTSSYVLHTTGLAILLLALLMVAIELRRGRAAGDAPARAPAWIDFFEVFGKNALFVFVLSGFVPRVLGLMRLDDGTDELGRPRFVALLPWVHRTVFEPIGGDPRLASLLYALANLAVYWALARWLDRRGIHLRV